jgi:type II secretory pathway component PulK
MKKLFNNQSGVALMMIMTSIIILMAIYTQFTFDSKISRIKATNILDRSQSKLLAEAGLQLAMTRLRLYKEAYNKVQSNADAKNAVTPQLLNQLWEVPFMYPIPVTANASAIFKQTIDKFTKDSFLEGNMKVSIQNISSRLNLNMLRIDITKLKVDANGMVSPPDTGNLFDIQGNERSDTVQIDQQIYVLLKRLVDDKKEKDEAFADKYSNINYQHMFTNLRYYISDYQSMNNDPLVGEAEATYQRIPMTPKFGPMGSSSELYAIPGWDDEIIELIKNEISVYPSMQIDLNKITTNMIKLLFPNLMPDDIADFFKYRDDPTNPKQMNSTDDMKRYFVDQARVLDSGTFDARINAFKNAGVNFGPNPNLFRVFSEGEYNRSIYTLVAYVVLPPQQQATQTTTNPNGPNPAPTPTPTPSPGSSGQGSNQTSQLLDPRIIEIQVN